MLKSRKLSIVILVGSFIVWFLGYFLITSGFILGYIIEILGAILSYVILLRIILKRKCHWAKTTIIIVTVLTIFFLMDISTNVILLIKQI